ncbi:ATP-binding protein [Sporosarcina sp. P34]|uniref:ATP-binding protein n=1 Tax=Sporosarcina sp. P34 TaxID=2048247 RepID=UPI000C16FEF6|nr:ATP-binding protein [Sporosarcina sp. P34]PID15876.1 ATP-binding protein [Sporosarcina sp. P34]
MEHRSSIEIKTEWDIVAARQLGRNEAKSTGFGTVDQARITTAISELARNIYLYAGKGRIEIVPITVGKRVGLLITASGGLGAGMPGVKRLMDDFRIETEVGVGTTITATKWLH